MSRTKKKPSSKSGRGKHRDAGPYLPGFAASETRPDPSGSEAMSTRMGWWVKTSATQELNAAGQPRGFKHTLMCGKRSVESGVGADAGRRLLALAEFANTRKQQPMAAKAKRISSHPDMPIQERQDGVAHIRKEELETTDTNH